MIDSDTLERLRQGNTHAFEQIVYSYQHEMLFADRPRQAR